MFRVCAALIAIACVAFAQRDQPVRRPQPPLPFFDWNACPFEGCAYRKWTARKKVPVYDAWNRSRKLVMELAPGAEVVGETGVVITYRPGLIHVYRDMPEAHVNAGQTLLTYASRGEGYSGVWTGGVYYPEFDISFTKWPDGTGCGNGHCAAVYVDLGEKEWWAKVKLRSGATGWVKAGWVKAGWVKMGAADFDGVDLLAR
jgi:hypothetical protein